MLRYKSIGSRGVRLVWEDGNSSLHTLSVLSYVLIHSSDQLPLIGVNDSLRDGGMEEGK